MIQLTEINKSYTIHSNKITALKDINLKIREGEFLAISGPSGAGKTTLLNMIAGLDKPDSGEVIVLGKKYSTLNDERMTLYRALNIGIVFQDYNLISTFTARENIELPLFFLEFEEVRIKRRALKMLNLVNLVERAEHLPSQLSNGEQRRISFARALVNDPPIILADEPTANLDKLNSEKIIALLNNSKSKEKTIIVVTHNQQILKLADRIVYLYEGELKKEKPSSLLENLF
ncbi:MAG: ABC transporter ATP-binding protein [Candidatus Helarchaeota archaeon]|nr:ABC transporter ATP-binding protein [Candidatus Helarchaeota archaeon]